MRHFLHFTLVTLLAFFTHGLFAQSDPQAKQDLLALKSKYDAGKSLQADVTLEIKFAEQPADVQTGRIQQDGDRFRVEFDQQTVISDGKTVWMYLPDNQEVQVYDANSDDTAAGFMRPQDFLTIYENDDYEYAIVGELTESGKTYRQIEFKPTDRDSEYAKIRLTYDPSKQEVRRVKVFAKDGSRFTLTLDSMRTGVQFEDARFSFREADYPGVMVEDMRL